MDDATIALNLDHSSINTGLPRAKELFSQFGEQVKSKLTGALGGAATMALGAFSGVASKLQSVFSDVIGVISSMMPGLTTDISAGLSSGFATLAEDETALARMQSVLKATGGVVGITAKEMVNMADAMSKATNFGGDVINSAQAALLQFRNIREDVFKKTLESAADMAAATGGDMTGAADKLGRALNDPVVGMRLLRSEGIIFSQAEQQVIARMLQTGKVAEAQRAILERVGDTFGGSAKGAADTFAGQLHQLNEVLDDVWKGFANALVPAIQVFIPWIKRGGEMVIGLADVFGEVIQAVVDWANQYVGVIEKWVTKTGELFKIAATWIIDRLTEAFTYVQTAAEDLPGYFTGVYNDIALGWAELVAGMKIAWEGFTVYVRNLFVDLSNYVLKLFGDMLKGIAGLIDKIPGIDKIFTKEQIMALKMATGVAGAVAQFGARGQKETAKGLSKEEQDRLNELRARARETGQAFGDAYAKNLERNQAAVGKLRDKAFAALGLGPEIAAEETPDELANNAGADFTFSKEAKDGSETKAGAFEDLAALQKRIQSAAFKPPEVKVTEEQTAVIRNNHRDSMKTRAEHLKELREMRAEQREYLKKLNEKEPAGLR